MGFLDSSANLHQQGQEFIRRKSRVIAHMPTEVSLFLAVQCWRSLISQNTHGLLYDCASNLLNLSGYATEFEPRTKQIFHRNKVKSMILCFTHKRLIFEDGLLLSLEELSHTRCKLYPKEQIMMTSLLISGRRDEPQHYQLNSEPIRAWGQVSNVTNAAHLKGLKLISYI